jgi:hypothetical protein
VYEPDGPFSDVLGAVISSRIGPYPALDPGTPSWLYARAWDLAFAGGWPWDRVEAARVAGRGLVKTPNMLRDGVVVGLAAAVTAIRPRPRHTVVKTVNAIMSLDWLIERYAPRVVLLRRSPLNVVSSWLTLDAGSQAPLELDPVVRRRYLDRLGLSAPPPGASKTVRVAWTVGLLMSVMKLIAEDHPASIVVSHDQLVSAPEDGFRDLYSRVGLEWTPATEEYIRASAQPGFAVHGGTAERHPNAVAQRLHPVEVTVDRSTQWRRRLTENQVSEATSTLAAFPLGDWTE